MSLLFVLTGVLLLYLGGEALVTHSARLARSWGVSPLVVGLTVVAFGTSSPEFAATLIAAARGVPALAFGNVVGSNTANIGLILGLTAIVHPMRAKARFLRREVPFMIGVSALLPLLPHGGLVGRLEGLVLLTMFAPYLLLLLGGQERRQVQEEFNLEYGRVRSPALYSAAGVVVGCALLVGGAYLLVEGAVVVARSFGVPERIIGLTLVALGTSLPELATSLVAAIKRESDIVLGNLVGSNVFNIIAVLGVASLLHPLRVDLAEVWLDIAVMLAMSLLALALFVTGGHRLGRLQGALLLAGYAAYVACLFH